MYTVTAMVVNAFSVPASEKYEESFKVQLIGDSHLKDGQVKKEMLTLSVPKDVFATLKDAEGEEVTLPVSFFVKNNQLNPFYPKTILFQ
jgi:hypothetical protein